MFKLRNYPLNELISNSMPATGLKKVGTGQQRAENARHFEKIQLGEQLINWYQVCNMISYKTDVLERQEYLRSKDGQRLSNLWKSA